MRDWLFSNSGGPRFLIRSCALFRSSDYPRTRMAAGQSFVGPSKRKMVVFAWFKPYIKSVVDFGRVGAGVVKSVLKYLHHLKGKRLVTQLQMVISIDSDED